MPDFQTNPSSESLAILTAVRVANEAASTVLSEITATGPTLTADQMVNGICTFSGQTGAQNVTTPTAAALIAAIPNAQIGSSFDFVIRNEHTSSGAITVVAGSGVTLDGTTAVPITKTQLYKGVMTSLTAVTLYGLLTAAI
jgi:hypothetical protein